MWKVGDLVASAPIGPQLQGRLDEVRERFEQLVAAAEADVGAQDPASNFGALLTALDLQIQAVDGMVTDLLACANRSGASRVQCEIDAWEDQREVTRAEKRVRAALQLVNIPDVDDGDTESVQFNVDVGECYNKGTPFDVVDCSSPHDGEVFGAYEIPEPLGSTYPGEAAIESVVGRECRRLFKGYVGVKPRFSELVTFYVSPSEGSWSTGDRTIYCLAQLESGRLRESVRGSGR